MSEKIKILAVVGPTASGKSALAVELARRLGGEVISCDSMQIYRGMDIGTAKPKKEEMGGIPHHLIDIASPKEPFSMAEYTAAAKAAVEDITARGKLPVFCGGTGLYLDAFLRGGAPRSPGADPAIREELTKLAAERGENYLHGLLAEVDPESAAATHPHNLRRVIRALEIYRATGIPKTEWDRQTRELPEAYLAAVLYLDFADRALLYERIERRVDEMMRAGLLEETRRLWEEGVFDASPTAAAAIGYKELLPYLRGEVDLAKAVETLKIATRRYAKRQITWFSAKDYIMPLRPDADGALLKYEEIVNNALEMSKKALFMI